MVNKDKVCQEVGCQVVVQAMDKQEFKEMSLLDMEPLELLMFPMDQAICNQVQEIWLEDTQEDLMDQLEHLSHLEVI